MTNSTFIQLHLLTAYPPSNLNRDDVGRPKTAIVGGVQRLRISSQSLKRAWRTSPEFASALEGHIGTRTKFVGQAILNRLTEKDPALASAVALAAAGQFGKLQVGKSEEESEDEQGKKKSKKKDVVRLPRTEQLVHLSPGEIAAMDALVETAVGGGDFEAEALDLLGRTEGAADIALFGRMLADHPQHSVEAAAQVGHAFTIHQAMVEEDYFSAVDDLQQDDNAGAGHIGVSEFGAGVFYQYICINRSQLRESLGDEGLTQKTLCALTQAVATVAPRGKIASYGSSSRALYVMAELGTQTPRSLMSAFVKPVDGKNVIEDGIDQLTSLCGRFDDAYGSCADSRATMNVQSGDGTFEEVLDFVGAGL